MLFDQVGHAVQDLRALLRRGATPGLGAFPRSRHGAFGILDGPARDLGKNLLVDRGDVLERGRGADAFATDPVLGVDLDALDGGGRARAALLPGARAGPFGLGSFGTKRYGSAVRGVKPA